MVILDDPYEILARMRGGWRLEKTRSVKGKWRLVKNSQYILVRHDVVYDLANHGEIKSQGPDSFVLNE